MSRRKVVNDCSPSVIPAQAGIQRASLSSHLRGNDGGHGGQKYVSGYVVGRELKEGVGEC